LLEFGWFLALESLAAALDVDGLVELDSVAAISDFAGLDAVGGTVAVDELPLEDPIFPSLAHPPTIRPKKVSQRIFLSMEAPP